MYLGYVCFSHSQLSYLSLPTRAAGSSEALVPRDTGEVQKPAINSIADLLGAEVCRSGGHQEGMDHGHLLPWQESIPFWQVRFYLDLFGMEQGCPDQTIDWPG